MAMKTGPEGRKLIQEFETCAKRTAPDVYEAYPDPATGGAPWTIGWGSTGKGINRGTTWSRAMCDARFEQDLAALEHDVNSLLMDKPTTQHQFDALISFAYNVGPDMDHDGVAEGLGDSTLLRKHLSGDYKGAKAEFAKWNKAKGKVMEGLTRRRAEEAALYGS